MPHSPEKIWRALTTSALIADWLMENDFEPEIGRKFQFRAKPMPGWKGITNCEVIEAEPPARLVYSWGDGSESESGLKTIVTWTLTPTPGGTLVRMEQSGFRPAGRAWLPGDERRLAADRRRAGAGSVRTVGDISNQI